MFDLIKTFVLGIWVEKKYRYIFIFISITIIYRFALWCIVMTSYELSPVEFVNINDNGSITFVYSKKYNETIYPYEFQLPTKYGHKNKKYDIDGVKNTRSCEREFFLLYKRAVNDLIKSSEDGKYILKFKKKILKNYGEISYYDRNKNEKYVFKTLYEQGFIFNKHEDIDYCEKLKERNIKI